MLAVWSDVLGPAVQVRAANAGAESYLFQGLDRRANYTFSVEQSDALRWGTSSRAAMDTTLYRGAAKTLKTDGSLVVADKVGIGTSEPASTLHVGGSQSVQRTAVKADYAVTESDYYIGVTDTSARRTVTLPGAAGKAGRSRSQSGIGEIKRLSFLAGWSGGERGSVDLDDRPRSTTSGTPARCGLAAGRSLPRSASARRIGSLVGYLSRH